MKKLFLSFAVLFTATIAANADDNKVYSLDINYLLQKDGSAVVTEVWDVEVAEGTEWYLVRNNMRDIEVRDFMVHDERWSQYIVEDEWDVDRDLEEKAGRCGIVETDEGLELCWGMGSYGRHTYTAVYTLTNAVQSLNDYDMFHFQTVNQKLSSAPEKVRTVIEVADYQLDTTVVRFWGFGYEGVSDLSDGKVVFESSEPFVEESSMICLVRFDKGIFDSRSVLEKDFEEHLSVALEHSGYIEEDDNGWVIFAAVMGGIILMFLGGNALMRKARRKVLGVNYGEVKESREIPFGGNLYIANKVMADLWDSAEGSSLAAALIVRMIYNDILMVRKMDDENIELRFNPEFNGEGLDGPALILYNMMRDASGSDGVLQEEEFENWASDHEKRVEKWDKAIEEAGNKIIEEKGYKQDGRYKRDFQMEACKLVGLKKYLEGFSELKKAEIEDVVKLKEYLVYATLFEIAEDVIEQINKVNPAAFEAIGSYDYWIWHRLVHHNTNLSRAIAGVVAADVSGTGGGSSFRGGAGFSGGGVGGGAR